MIDNDKYGHYVNDNGEIEYFPVITRGGKRYNLTALKALLLVLKNFDFSMRIYDFNYQGKKYQKKTYRIKSYGGRKRKY